VETAPPECSERDDCETGETCLEGSCAAVAAGGACTDDESCGRPQVCDPDRGETPACVDPCERDQDCEGLEDIRACDLPSGLCQPAECTTRDHCDVDEVCNEAHECEIERFPCDSLTCDDPEKPFETEPLEGLCRCVQCLTPNQCSTATGETCTDSNRCLYCEVHPDEEGSCPEEQPLRVDDCCTECAADEDCSDLGLGSICNRGRCVPCNCNAGCTCPEGADCEDQEGVGVCVRPLGQQGDPCQAQAHCEDFLACSYAVGECVNQGAGSFCTAEGCTEPTRCGSTTGGAVCFGCHSDEECPAELECVVPSEWEGVYDGGQCLDVL
jgi:hypothetical protein